MDEKLTDDVAYFGSEEHLVEDNLMQLSDWLRGGRDKGFYHEIKRIWSPPNSRIFVVHYTRTTAN